MSQDKLKKMSDSESEIEKQLLPIVESGTSTPNSSSPSSTSNGTTSIVSTPFPTTNVLLFGEVNLAANFPPMRKLNSTEYSTFKEWKISAITYFGQHGLQELVTKPIVESLALAITLDTSSRSQSLIRTLYLRLHRKVSYVIRAAIELTVGESFFAEIESKQSATDSGSSDFYVDNSHYLWEKLCRKYEKRTPHDTARVVNELLFLKYNTSEHPKQMKKRFIDLEKELQVLGIKFHPDVLAVLWMNAILHH
jgi:hypothetical protein